MNRRFLISQLRLLLLSLILWVLFGINLAIATPINPLGGGNGSESNLQQILNSITVAPISGVSSINVDTDQHASDHYWTITSAGGSSVSLIIEIAGYASINTFGIYDYTDPTKRVVLFSGSTSAGAQSIVYLGADGSVFVNFVDSGVNFAGNLFGYFLANPYNTFYSGTGLNKDGFDHMVAFQGKNIDTVQLPGLSPSLWTSNEYILAWEDLDRGGDYDYNDMVLMVRSVAPVPEPMALILLGSGLLTLVFWGRSGLKFRKRKEDRS